MKVVMRGMQTGTGGTYRPTIRLLEQDGSDYFSGSGSNPSATYAKFGVEGKSYNSTNTNISNTTQEKYMTRYNVYRDSGGASNSDYFSQTTINADESYNSNCCWNGVVYINPATSPSMISKIDYIDNMNNSNYYNEQVYLGNLAASIQPSNVKGHHPMGVLIRNNASNNWVSGVVELYGVFKDGVVS